MPLLYSDDTYDYYDYSGQTVRIPKNLATTGEVTEEETAPVVPGVGNPITNAGYGIAPPGLPVQPQLVPDVVSGAEGTQAMEEEARAAQAAEDDKIIRQGVYIPSVNMSPVQDVKPPLSSEYYKKVLDTSVPQGELEEIADRDIKNKVPRIDAVKSVAGLLTPGQEEGRGMFDIPRLVTEHGDIAKRKSLLEDKATDVDQYMADERKKIEEAELKNREIRYAKYADEVTNLKVAEFKARERMAKDIDPNRAWKNTSNVNKFFTILGLFMGGYTDNANILNMYQRTIDNDIDAQKTDIESAAKQAADIARSKGLLADEFAIGEDIRAKIRIDKLSILASEVEKRMSVIDSERTKIGIMEGLVNLKSNIAAMIGEAAQKQAEMQLDLMKHREDLEQKEKASRRSVWAQTRGQDIGYAEKELGVWGQLWGKEVDASIKRQDDAIKFAREDASMSADLSDLGVYDTESGSSVLKFGSADQRKDVVSRVGAAALSHTVLKPLLEELDGTAWNDDLRRRVSNVMRAYVTGLQARAITDQDAKMIASAILGYPNTDPSKFWDGFEEMVRRSGSSGNIQKGIRTYLQTSETEANHLLSTMVTPGQKPVFRPAGIVASDPGRQPGDIPKDVISNVDGYLEGLVTDFERDQKKDVITTKSIKLLEEVGKKKYDPTKLSDAREIVRNNQAWHELPKSVRDNISSQKTMGSSKYADMDDALGPGVLMKAKNLLIKEGETDALQPKPKKKPAAKKDEPTAEGGESDKSGTGISTSKPAYMVPGATIPPIPNFRKNIR
jgi:hypothetical protein